MRSKEHLPKVLLLDVDGVLITGRPRDGKPWASSLKADLGIDPDQLHRDFFVPHWENIVTGKTALRAVLGECLRRFAPSVSVDRLITYWFEADSRIERGVLDQLDDLRGRGFPVFLATNQEHLRAKYLMQDLGLSHHVDGMFCSAEIKSKKPDLAFFLACERALHRVPADLLLVDDTLANVQAARDAGWSAVHWSGSGNLLDYV